MSNILTFPDQERLAQNFADNFVDLANEAVESQGVFTVALSGGSTPRSIYELLATQEYADSVPWPGVHFFWGDERFVPSDHPSSNYRMVRLALLEKVSIPKGNIHRIPTEFDPNTAADLYEKELRKFFQFENLSSRHPLSTFDLVLLGVGLDGHTASLFPQSSALSETNRLVVASYIPDMDTWRVTITIPLIRLSKRVVFIVTGKEKAEIIQKVFRGIANSGDLPAQTVHQEARLVTWMLDADASSMLNL